MCGISGFIDFSSKSTQDDLEKMNNQMHHRGPDGEGYWLENTTYATIGLAHKRLSIIDLSENGKQPMTYKHLTLTFNGEIYNYKTFQKELISLGHTFNGHSDTEALLHAIDAWGLDETLKKCRGMFVMTLFNKEKNTVHFVRDRAGVKPLYIHKHADGYLFGSELKALLPHSFFKKELNHSAINAYFKFGYIPEPLTIYKNTFKLKPGSYQLLNLSDHTITETIYWDAANAYHKPKLAIDKDKAIEQTKHLLKESIALRLVSDVPVGVFLSGGYDSSLVAAMSKEVFGDKPLKTFTIGFEDKKYNEAEYAKEIAAYLGTEHNELYCTEQAALDLVKEIPFYFDEPFGDSSSIPTMMVSEFASEQVTVSLSADAGDELFAGYNKYDQLISFENKLKPIPSVFKKLMAGVITNSITKKIIALVKPHLKSNLDYKTKKLAALLKASTPLEYNSILNKKFFDSEINQLLITNQDEEKPTSNESLDILNHALLSDYKTYLTDDIMTKVDRATMRASLEGREPLLDNELLEFVAKLPNELKYNAGSKKDILKEIAHQYIPKKLLDRPKKGFSIPIDNWMQVQFKDKFFELTTPVYLQNQGIFNASKIEELKDKFFNKKTEKAERIWMIFMFQLWYDKWMK